MTTPLAKIKKIVRWKIKKASETKMSFIRTLFITYVLAIAMVLIPFILTFETIGYGNYLFAKCNCVNWYTYLVFSLIQTLVTATIPFAATIYVLQSDEKKHKSVRTFVIILLCILAMLCIIQTTLTSVFLLWLITILNFAFIIITIVCCWILYCLPEDNFRAVKKEFSDGKPIT